jgi:ribonucleoside-diphosphate reductase alpha chain
METLSDNAIQILEDRYLLNDKNGVLIETPEQLFVRVAKPIRKQKPPSASKMQFEHR